MLNAALFQRAVRAMALATRFSATVVSGLLVGLGADRLLGWSPLGLLSCSLAALILATWSLLRDTRNSFDEHPPSPPHSDDPGPGRDRS